MIPIAFKTWVAAEILTASDVNTYLGKQAVIVCTSGTRPASPVEGMTIYETDTDKFLVYDAATWNLPKNVAGGTLGYAEATAAQNGISAITDLTSLSVAVTVGAGRRIRITGHGRTDQQSSTGAVIGSIREGATSVGKWADATQGAATAHMNDSSVILTPTAGAHTYKLSLETSAGTVNLAADAGSTKAFILVEDIGA